ncbi:hypothetical protein IFU39_16950 [Paenibacillus sp. CFBP 13594]|uniref:zinc-ribbon domain-containing protein n=1 Tax=Paenibacillus sp. CFBP 13594 TaxID=2774037 RepID=UPI00177E82BF|nr:hypothetical protein [Paenibacillus sp. CFBP 13594]
MKKGIPLAQAYPESISQWNFRKNTDIKLDDVSSGSHKKVWWICEHGHEWEETIKNRFGVYKRGCPYCSGRRVSDKNSLFVNYPDKMTEWDWNKNKSHPNDISFGSKKKAWWICSTCNSSYDMIIGNKTTKNQGCPYCSGNRVNATNSLLNNFPKVSREWSYTLNTTMKPDKISKYSNKKAWWTCNKCKSDFYSIISDRTFKGQGCPYCAGKSVNETNSLRTTHPRIVREWNYEMNSESPDSVTHGSVKVVWWTCNKCKSNYDMSVDGRAISGLNCPYCVGRRVNDTNSLAQLRKDLLDEWNFERNSSIISPHEVTVSSRKRVWWKCKKGHEWEAVIYSRSYVGCPRCKESKGELSVQRFLDANKINYKRQWTFSDCINKQSLPFDFAVLDKCNMIMCLIEFDGEFHYRPMMGEERLQYIQHNDKIKDDYCKDNNIPLIRIPYWEFKNIDSILTERLTELGVLSPALVEV